jgi:Tripartite tricarboxylate transporter family receptor/ABC transporter substrate binding protein
MARPAVHSSENAYHKPWFSFFVRRTEHFRLPLRGVNHAEWPKDEHENTPTETGSVICCPLKAVVIERHPPRTRLSQRDGSVVCSLHCMNDPQPEGHMASHIGRRKFLATLGAVAAWPLAARACCTPAAAGDYPARPVTLIIPFPAGGGVDTIGRVIAAKLTVALGQQVIVENRAGAGSMIGIRAGAKAAPDGYTILMATTGASVPVNTGYDIIKDFTPIGLIASIPITVVFITADDPVRLGLVASVNRPGGNATGMNLLTSVLVAKQFELLHELVPHASVIGFLVGERDHADNGLAPWP